MVEVSVLPLGWSQISGSGINLVLALPPGDSLVGQLRAVLSTRRGTRTGVLDDVIDVLLQAGVRGMPDFAAVDESDPLRLIVRGAPVFEVTVAGELRSIVSGGARTWVDLEISEAVELVRLNLPVDQTVEPEPEPEPAPKPAPEADAEVEPGPGAQPVLLAGQIPAAPTAVHEFPSWPEEAPATAPVNGISSPISPPLPVVREHPLGAGTSSTEQHLDDRQELPSYDDLFGSTGRAMAFHADEEPKPAKAAAVAAPLSSPTPLVASDLTLPPPAEGAPVRPATPSAQVRSDERAPSAPSQVTTPQPGAPSLIASVPWAKASPAGSAPATAGPAPRPGGGVVSPAPRISMQRTLTPAVAAPAAPLPMPPAANTAATTPPPQAAALAQPTVPAYSGGDKPDVDVTVDRSALLAASQAALAGPTVLAVLCPAGHPSPAHAGDCRICHREIPSQQPYNTARPALGVIRLSTGDVVKLDRGVLLGRAPKINGDPTGADRPHVLRLPSPDNDISRNHVEILLEGWHVLVRDLGSTNGTTVALPGQEPIRLRPHDQQVIEPGTVVDLADEVSFTYEVQS